MSLGDTGEAALPQALRIHVATAATSSSDNFYPKVGIPRPVDASYVATARLVGGRNVPIELLAILSHRPLPVCEARLGLPEQSSFSIARRRGPPASHREHDVQRRQQHPRTRPATLAIRPTHWAASSTARVTPSATSKAPSIAGYRGDHIPPTIAAAPLSLFGVRCARLPTGGYHVRHSQEQQGATCYFHGRHPSPE